MHRTFPIFFCIGLFTVWTQSLTAISPLCQQITDLDNGIDYAHRWRSIQQINRPLGKEDWQQYFAFLRLPPAQAAMPSDHLDALKNDIVDRLLLQPDFPQEWAQDLLAQIQSTELGTVWPGYVIQKLDDLWLQSNQLQMRQHIVSLLYQECHNPAITHAGTALLTLERMVQAERLEAKAVATAAAQVIANDKIAYQDKMSALQVAARLGHPQAGAFAADALQEDSPIMLKVSALATLGIVQDAQYLPLIEPYLKAGDFRLRKSAQGAHRRITQG